MCSLSAHYHGYSGWTASADSTQVREEAIKVQRVYVVLLQVSAGVWNSDSVYWL